jgi:uncharacterized protein YjbJ (UPF0337 family)
MGSLNANLKDAAGYVKEETGEMLNSPKMAQEGRNLRNEGRVEKGEFPKMSQPGTQKEKKEREDKTKH